MDYTVQMCECYEQHTNHKRSRRMLATTLTMVLFFLALISPPVLSQETDQRMTDSVDDLFTTCPRHNTLLIREARFGDRTTCNGFCQSGSPDIECHYSDLLKKCTARFSLHTLSRVYSGVEAGDRTAWEKIVDEIDRYGKYKISYLCVKARGLKPCSTTIREHGTTIAIFHPTDPQAKGQHCEMQCDVTLERSSDRTVPLEWEHQFVLQDGPLVKGNNVLYRIVFSIGDNQQSWTRFQPSLLTKEVVPSWETNVEKLRLKFRFQNVSNVLRFWLDFPHTTVNVVCGRDEKSTTMTSSPITTSSPGQPQAPTLHPIITAGTIVHLFVIPVLVLHLLLFAVLIVFLAKKRRNQRQTGEESPLLMTTRRRSSV